MSDTAPGPSAQAEGGVTDHVAESVEAVANFHHEHYRGASNLQRGIDAITDRLGRPSAVIVLTFILVGWGAYAASRGGGRVDQPSFAWLELAATIAALMVSVLILVTQRREDQLADRRAQLTLELALLADKKSAKIIELLEALRRDQPDVADRIDPESDAMAKPTDAKAVAASIDEESDRPRD